MNEVVTKQNGGKKLRQTKAKIAGLRGILACCSDPKDIEEIQQMISGARFMHDIYEQAVLMDSRKASAAKHARARQRMWLLRAITVAVLLAIIFMSYGCQTLQGVKGDIHWLTADVEHSKQ